MDFRISVDIAAPPDIVWGVMSDPERWHEWTASVRSIRLLDKGPLTLGTRALIRQPKFPPAVWTITAIDPGKGFAWKSGAPGMWVHAQHSVEPIAGGARATLALHYDGIFGGLMATLTRGITNRYLGYEAAGLKRRAEERRAMKRILTARPPTPQFDIVTQVALTLRGVTLETKYDGTPVLKLGGAFLAGLASHVSAEPETLIVRMDVEDRQLLLEEAPDVYYVTDYYEPYPVVLVRLSRVNEDALRDLLTVSWRLTLPKSKLRTQK